MQGNGIIIAGTGRGLCVADMFKADGGSVSAIVEPNSVIHRQLRERLDGTGLNDTPIFNTIDEALSSVPRTVADKVYVATRDFEHLDFLSKALIARRHVLLEKPLAASREDVIEIMRLANSTNLIIQVGFVLRYSEFYRKVKEITADGLLGTITMIQMSERLDLDHGGGAYRRGWRRKQDQTGGFLNEKSSHDLDLMCWFKEPQAQPLEVFSYGGRHLFPERPAGKPQRCSECDDSDCPFRHLERSFGQDYQLYRDENLEGACVYATDADVLNHQSVTVIFEDGTQGVFTLLAYSGDPARDIQIHGTEGFLYGNLVTGELKVKVYRGKKTLDFSRGSGDMHGGGDKNVLSDFIECVRTGKRPDSTVADGARASLLAFAADDSVASGQKVSIREYLPILKAQTMKQIAQ